MEQRGAFRSWQKSSGLPPAGIGRSPLPSAKHAHLGDGITVVSLYRQPYSPRRWTEDFRHKKTKIYQNVHFTYIKNVKPGQGRPGVGMGAGGEGVNGRRGGKEGTSLILSTLKIN